jgi:hypothetical protein
MSNQSTPPITIRGNSEMLARLRTWVEPLVGKISDRSLRELQIIIEDGVDAAVMVPQYRKSNV